MIVDLSKDIGAALDRRQAQAEAAMPHFLALFGDLPEPLADFLAAYDPPSVLRQVEADRRVLARHSGYHWCVPCGNKGSWRDGDPCPDLVDLAARYEVPTH